MFGVEKAYTLRKRSFRRPIHGFILVEQAVVVGVHSPRKVPFPGGLHLDVDQNPLLLAAAEPHLDEAVHPSFPKFRLAHNLSQFLVQGLVSATPVDLGMGLGTEQGQKRFEVLAEGLFPGAVIIVRSSRESPQNNVVHGWRGRGGMGFPRAR